MRRILAYVRHAGGFGRGGLVLALVFLAGGLQGCASWTPEGAHGLNDVIADGDLRALPKAQVRALVLVDPRTVDQTIDRQADGFFGGSCEVSFRLYPELYLQTYEKLAAIYARVDIAEAGAPVAGYDLTVSPRIDDVRWNAGGLSANLAAVAAHFQIQGPAGLRDVRAYQMAKGELGRVHNGCHDATISAARGARAAVGLAVNRMVLDLSRQGAAQVSSRGDGKAPAVDKARAAALLARLDAGRGQAGSLRSQQDHSALIAAGLDVAGATFDLQGQAASAQAARQLAQGLRSQAPAYPGGANAPQAGGDGAPPAGAIPVPPEAASASCQGDYAFLAPYLRAYRAPGLADIRHRMLTARVPDMVDAMRAQGQGGADVAAALRRQAAESERAANEAAQGARASDGHGDVSIPMARADTLPLDFSCGDGAAIHAGMVCSYVLHRWDSLFERTTADLYERCR